MNISEVELLVRGVIVHRGLPFALMSVTGGQDGWTVVVRGERGEVVRFGLSGDRPVAMRVAIQEKLEAEL